MALRFVHKRFSNRVIKDTIPTVTKDVEESKNEEKKTNKPKNNKVKKENNMDTIDKISAAENVVEDMAKSVKVLKKDRGLIERTESSKIILTEDNRQVLND